jgi:twinkle protein
VIDPWNKLDHQYEGSETSYISRCLDEMDIFNKKNNVHGFLVAHPTKMQKDDSGDYAVPNLYSISGSAHFFNKAALGWTVYKKGDGLSDVHVQKVKFKYWGEIGLINYLWDDKNGRYYLTNRDNSNWLKPKELGHPDLYTQSITDEEMPF